MITRDTWKRGLQAGLQTAWTLGKIVFPITLIVGFLKYTPVIDVIIAVFSPIMEWFGLPGTAAIPITLGFVLNLYAAIGAMLSLSLTVKHVFILAVILSFAHNLIVETAVCKKIGVNVWVTLTIRLGLAFGSAFLIEYFWKGGQSIAQYGLLAQTEETFQSWGWAVQQAFTHALIGLLQLLAVIFPLMLGIQLLKEGQVLKWIAKATVPFTRMLGLPDNAALTLMAGVFFGIAFGAGVIIQSAEEENFTKRDVTLLVLFLAACHAVVEDTLLFVPLGIPVIYLLLVRLVVAILATSLFSRLLRKNYTTFNKSKGAV